MPLIQFLEASAAVPAFRQAVRAFAATSQSNDLITFPRYAPAIKVERTLTKILESYPDLPIESVAIDGRSGCEFFRGEAIIRTSTDERRVYFHWDCRWKALQLGWTDYWGYPDQVRAAQELGYDCFRGWTDSVAA
jgi:hypothetical protein